MNKILLILLFTFGLIPPIDAQEMLDPNTWESMELIPPINPEFIRLKGISSILFEVKKKRPDERLKYHETHTYNYDWDGNLVEHIRITPVDVEKTQFIFEDNLLKIKTTIANNRETRIVYVFDNYGKVIERQYFRRKVGEPVKGPPFKAERITRRLINEGKRTEEKIINHFGVQQKSTTTYKDDQGLPVEQVIRTPGKNVSIHWVRNSKNQMELWRKQSNYLKMEYSFTYRDKRLDAMVGNRGSKKESFYYQYEGPIKGALSSILRTNMQTKVMEVVQVSYTTF